MTKKDLRGIEVFLEDPHQAVGNILLKQGLETYLREVSKALHTGDLEPNALESEIETLKGIRKAGEQAKAYLNLYEHRKRVNQASSVKPEQGPPYKIYSEELIALYLMRDITQQHPEKLHKPIPVDAFAIAGLIPVLRDKTADGENLFRVAHFSLNTCQEVYYSREINAYLLFMESESLIDDGKSLLLNLSGKVYIYDIARMFNQNKPRTAAALALALDTTIDKLV